MQMFQPDSRLIRLLTRLCDLFFLNILSTFLCITVIFSGTAITSLYTATLKMIQDEDSEPVKRFLQSVRENFSISVPATILLFMDVFLIALIRCALYSDTLIFSPYMLVLLMIAAVILTALISYVFPLTANFNNTFLRHLGNAGRLALANLPVTFLLTTVNLCPILLAIFLPQMFRYLAVFWLVIGIAASAYFNSFYLCRIFDR